MEAYFKVDDKCIKTGRGPGTYNHTGNIVFRSMVEKHLPSYKKSTKQGKTAIIDAVYQDISESGMRFIETEDGVWKVVDNGRHKVAHRFRDAFEAEKRKTVAARKRDKVRQTLTPSTPAPCRPLLCDDSRISDAATKCSPLISAAAVVQGVEHIHDQILVQGTTHHEKALGNNEIPGKSSLTEHPRVGAIGNINWCSDGVTNFPDMLAVNNTSESDTDDTTTQHWHTLDEQLRKNANVSSPNNDSIVDVTSSNNGVGRQQLSDIFAEVTELMETTLSVHIED